jgi:1-acyl-sn-glycerol-3-phosphate acyltransferase
MEKEKTQKEIDNEYVYDNGFKPKEVILKDDYKLYKKGFFFWFYQRITIYLTKFFLFFPKKLLWGYKVVGKKNKKHIKSSVVVCNPTFQLDAFSILTALSTPQTYTLTLPSNLGSGIVSKYFRAGGGVPIPTKMNLYKRFVTETPEILKSGKNILIFPEAMLMPYCDHIREFKPGAFHFATDGAENIVILLHTFHKPRGLYKLTRRKKPCIHLNVLEPYHIEKLETKKETINKVQSDIQKIMTDYFNEHSDYFKKEK